MDPDALVHGGLPEGLRHLAQESFHPSAAGHAELGRCVGEFLRADPARAVEAACRVGADGHLHTAPLPGSVDAAAAQRTTRSRGRVLSRSQPSSVTTTMSSMRAPHAPSRYTPGSTLNAMPGSSSSPLPPTM